MKRFKGFIQNPLGQSGMFHYIVPLIIVVLFGIGGAAYYVFSLAATPTPELRVGSTPGGVAICLTAELDQGVSAHPCNGAVDQRWSATGGTIRNTAISGGPWCIAGNGTATPYGVHVAVCNGSSAQGWGRPVWSSTNLKLAPIGSELYNYAPYPTHKDCLVDPSGANGGTLEAVGCGSEANIQANPAYEDQVWVITTYTAASSGGGGNGGEGSEATAICKSYGLNSNECNNVGIAVNQVASGYPNWNNQTQLTCLGLLWYRESAWSQTASNPSGAYGIPQADPGDKMASAGANWQTSASTQIKWGLSYIKQHYSYDGEAVAPCTAKNYDVAHNSYTVKS